MPPNLNLTFSRFVGDDETPLKIGMPWQIAVDGSWRVYITAMATDAIVMCERDGTGTWHYHEPGAQTGQLRDPVGVVLNPMHGTVFISEAGNRRVSVFGRELAFYEHLNTGLDLGAPGKMALDPLAETLYVPDRDRDCVYALATSGEHRFTLHNDFLKPAAVAAGHDGRLYVADTENHRVQVFDPQGAHLFMFGGFGEGPGQFHNPRDLTITPDGMLLVADTDNHRLQLFSPDGTFVDAYGSADPAEQDHPFLYVTGVAVGRDGTVYVSDFGHERVHILRPVDWPVEDWPERIDLIARARVQKAMDAGETTLDLSGMLLKSLPDNLWDFTTVEEMYLFGNHLTDIPGEIVRLPNLRVLELRANRFRSFPRVLTRLSQLEVLNLADHAEFDLPPEIGNLTNLRVLDLQMCHLSYLPPEIGKLTRLRVLLLNDNEIVGMPPEIRHLTHLTSLSLDRNPLRGLPPEIGHFWRLKHLSMSYYVGGERMPLTALPPEIGNLTDLETLDVANTNLEMLPPEIGKLANLRRLNLANNRLRTLPDALTNLTALEELYLLGNPMDEIPNIITALPNLHTIQVPTPLLDETQDLPDNFDPTHLDWSAMSENEQMTWLARCFRHWARMGVQTLEIAFIPMPEHWPPEVALLNDVVRHLMIHGLNDVTALPPEIGLLTNLESLTLFEVDDNLRLPPEIVGLKGLTTLSLGAVGLILPPEIGLLPKLSVIDADNAYLQFPDHLLGEPPLPRLTEIHIGYGAAMNQLPENIGDCPALRRLHFKEVVGFDTLPASLANLHLKSVILHADNLASLPPGLTVDELVIQHSRLSALPSRLTVGTLRFPRRHHTIDTLPDDITIHEWVDIAHTDIHTVPDTLPDSKLRIHGHPLDEMTYAAFEHLSPRHRELVLVRLGLSWLLRVVTPEVVEERLYNLSEQRLLQLTFPDGGRLALLRLSDRRTGRTIHLRLPDHVRSLADADGWLAVNEDL